MRTYDTYKDSGISWLGQIPSHWDVKRLGSYFTERRQKVSDKDYEPLSVTKQGIFPQLENVAKTNDGDNRKLVRKGDFVINSRSDRKGSSGVSELDGSVSLINIVLEPHQSIIPTFCNFLLKSHGFIEEYYRIGRGIVADLWTTRYQEMKFMPLAVPPLAEQEAIVAYLDSATAEIDKAIASQQRMVELLQERKQIIINQAVTQGLNPDAPMKPTNIDWLPQIPTHWQLKKIKYVVLLKSGQNLTSEQIEKEDLYPVYGGNGLRGYYSDYNNDGDYVLIGRQGALCGNINYAHNKFWATEHAVVCYPVDRVNVLWLGETLRAMNLNRYATASAQPGLAVENIKGLMMPVPDYKEQNDIAVFIEKQTKPIDESIESCNRMIGALTERKQILINDVVTGKIKVSYYDY